MIVYKKVTGLPLSEKEMNEYGKEGWDNYAIVGNVYWFKKEVSAGANMIPADKIKTDNYGGSKNRK